MPALDAEVFVRALAAALTELDSFFTVDLSLAIGVAAADAREAILTSGMVDVPKEATEVSAGDDIAEVDTVDDVDDDTSFK